VPTQIRPAVSSRKLQGDGTLPWGAGSETGSNRLEPLSSLTSAVAVPTHKVRGGLAVIRGHGYREGWLGRLGVAQVLDHIRIGHDMVEASLSSNPDAPLPILGNRPNTYVAQPGRARRIDHEPFVLPVVACEAPG